MSYIMLPAMMLVSKCMWLTSYILLQLSYLFVRRYFTKTAYQ